MLGHLGINVSDLVAAKRHYDAPTPMLGYERFFSDGDQFTYQPSDGRRGAFLFFYRAREEGEIGRNRPGLQHLALIVPTRSAVSSTYDSALGLGSEAVHPPQEFPQYPSPYFATFWLDPFGLMLEAVCHHDRDQRTLTTIDQGGRRVGRRRTMTDTP